MDHPLRADLDHILVHTEPFWRDLSGARFFLTGCTGFFGIWFLEAAEWARARLGTRLELTVLSRNPGAFLAAHPRFHGRFEMLTGDVTSFPFPRGSFSHILHAAAPAAHETFAGADPLGKFETLVNGTRRVLQLASESGATQFWFTSSGSVYGRQSAGLGPVAEDSAAAPDPLDLSASLGHGKRAAEFLVANWSANHRAEAKIARCFSFLGPYLPLDLHYAVGNFLGDATAGRAIRVRGDGLPIRSYLYSADLVIWLLHVFCRGRSNTAYNVGSEEAVSIGELARLVAKCDDRGLGVDFSKDPLAAPRTAAPDFYVPCTRKAREELALAQWIPLREGINRTLAYLRDAKGRA